MWRGGSCWVLVLDGFRWLLGFGSAVYVFFLLLFSSLSGHALEPSGIENCTELGVGQGRRVAAG